MKAKDIANLIPLILGVAGGLGSTWLLPGAHWGVFVFIGFVVMTGAALAMGQTSKGNKAVEE